MARFIRSDQGTDHHNPSRGKVVGHIGPHPAHTDGAACMPRRVEPIGEPWVLVGNNKSGSSIVLELGRVAVERGLVIVVVEGLPSSGCAGDHPVVTRRRRYFDQKHLVVGQVEIRLVPLDSKILEVPGLG